MIPDSHHAARGFERLPTALAIALLLFLGATDCYRAARRPLTSLERNLNWTLLTDPKDYPSGKPKMGGFGIFVRSAVVKPLGLSELTLRLPDVGGRMLYLATIWLLCRMAFGGSVWFLFAVALGALNPLILEDVSAATGYGLGLGFWGLGAYFIARWTADGARIPIAAGVALGLAVASDPVQVFAVTALEAVFIIGAMSWHRRRGDGWGATLFVMRDAVPFCLAGAVTAVGFRLRGGASFADEIRSRLLSPQVPDWLAWLGWGLDAAVFACLTSAALWIMVRWMRREPAERTERLFVLFSASSVAAAALILWVSRPAAAGSTAAPVIAVAQPPVFMAMALFLTRASTGSRQKADSPV